MLGLFLMVVPLVLAVVLSMLALVRATWPTEILTAKRLAALPGRLP